MIVGRSMVREAGEFWRLEEAELRRLGAAAREVDSVELKLVVPAPARDATCAALGVEWKRARSCRVFFLDTPDRALDRHGVVARVRSIAGEPDDSVVKLRPVDPGDLPRTPAPLQALRRGDRRDAGRLRLLGRAEGAPRAPRGRAGDGRAASAAGAVLEAAAGAARRRVCRRLSGSTTWRSSGRSTCVAARSFPAASGARWPSSSGRIPTARRSSSSRRAARPTRRWRPPRERRRCCARTASASPGAQRTKTRATLDFFGAHDSGAA